MYLYYTDSNLTQHPKLYIVHDHFMIITGNKYYNHTASQARTLDFQHHMSWSFLCSASSISMNKNKNNFFFFSMRGDCSFC